MEIKNLSEKLFRVKELFEVEDVMEINLILKEILNHGNLMSAKELQKSYERIGRLLGTKLPTYYFENGFIRYERSSALIMPTRNIFKAEKNDIKVDELFDLSNYDGEIH